MTRLPPVLLVLPTLLVLVVASACGGGEGQPTPSLSLTDPRTVPTATPWTQPPEPTYVTETGTTKPRESATRYTVQPGDTPLAIAQQFGVDVEELMRLNNITDPTRLFVGQVLIIPPRGEGATPQPTPTATPTPTAIPPGSTTYTVQEGDNPSIIAQRFGVDVEELMRLNNITDPTKLFVGQVLIIPPAESTPTATPTATPAAPTPTPTPSAQ